MTWAARNGIVKGVTTQEFCPHKAITREQIAAILYRYYADYLGNTPSSASLNGYTDQDAVSGFARDAMAWAVCSGLIRGVNASNEAPRLDPKATSNRAQVATLMVGPSAAPASESLILLKRRKAFLPRRTGITPSTPLATAPAAATPKRKYPPPIGTALPGKRRRSCSGRPLPQIMRPRSAVMNPAWGGASPRASLMRW